jgi:hypothetical protein
MDERPALWTIPSQMGDGTVGPYYAKVGPGIGLVMHRDVAGSIDVFEDLDCSIPIGTARCVGWDAAGSAVWRLVVQDDEFDGPWVIVDREFLSTRPEWRDLYRSDFDSELDRPASVSLSRGRRRLQRPRTLETTLAGMQPSHL